MTRRFWLKLALFVIPFALPVGLFTSVMAYSGESLPLALVVAQQMGDAPVLYRPQYGNRDFPFKVMSVNARQPEVVALGSSRVLQMRAGLLTENPRAFYNAGAPAWRLSEIEAFIREIDHAPKVLILGIDAPWFLDAYMGDESAGVTINPLNDFQQVFAVNRSTMQDIFIGRAPNWDKVLTRSDSESGGLALGLKAIQNGHGFRNDGSEQYGDFLVGRFLDQATERQRHIVWMRRGEEMYVYGDTVSERALNELTALLETCKERGITVIGFMPPFVPTLYARMIERGNHPYIPKLIQRLDAIFTEQDLPFFDFSDGARFGTDEDFYDGWHGSEHIYLRVYTAMLDALPDVLGVYSDIDALRALDASVTNTWRVFGS